MERLTERITNKYTGKVLAYRTKCKQEIEAVQKLGELEDLEEQGKLIRLPVAVGDTVYQISSRYTQCSEYGAEKDNCVGCEKECDSHKEYCIREIKPQLNFIVEWMNVFGKELFTTREAAEAALREMEGK